MLDITVRTLEPSETEAVHEPPIAFCWTCGFWNPDTIFEPLGLYTRAEADIHAKYAHDVVCCGKLTRGPRLPKLIVATLSGA